MLPVQEIAINKQNPSNIIYFEKNASWFDDRPLYSIFPNEKLTAFDSLASTLQKEKVAVYPIGKLEFKIIGHDNDTIFGQGAMSIWAILNDKTELQYIQSFTYEGKDTSGNSKTINIPPVLLREGENGFDIGAPVEKLVKEGLLLNEWILKGELTNSKSGQKNVLTYDSYSDGVLVDGYLSKEEYYGPEYYVLSNMTDTLKKLKTGLDSLGDASFFWNKIKKSNEWLKYEKPVSKNILSLVSDQSEESELISQTCEALPDTINAKQLKTLLDTMKIAWNEDYLFIYLLTTTSVIGKSEIITIQGQQDNRHDDPTNTFVDWVIRFSDKSIWRHVILPTENPIGLWPLDNSGNSSILLTADKGYYLTDDAGKTWQPANFNESELADGIHVKTFVVDKNSVYALFDRGGSINDNGNPLFLLQTRNWWQRWKTGIIDLLK